MLLFPCVLPSSSFPKENDAICSAPSPLFFQPPALTLISAPFFLVVLSATHTFFWIGLGPYMFIRIWPHIYTSICYTQAYTMHILLTLLAAAVAACPPPFFTITQQPRPMSNHQPLPFLLYTGTEGQRELAHIRLRDTHTSKPSHAQANVWPHHLRGLDRHTPPFPLPVFLHGRPCGS